MPGGAARNFTMQVVTVAVPRPLRRLFDYGVGDDGVLPAPGSRVRVPFGAAEVVGVVAGHAQGSEHDLKPIGEVFDETPLLTPDLIELANWLARYYHHPIGGAYAALLPKLARRGAPARATRLVTWQPTVEAPPAALARAPAQRRALAMLIEYGGVDDADVVAAGVPRRVLQALEGRGLVRGVPVEPTYGVSPGGIELTDEQREAVAAVNASHGTAAVHLLQGVTGSGKTEVYMRAIERVLEAGQQALVLVPEIALTPQTTRRFRARFGAAATLHSGATDRQRFDAWIDCRNGRHRILIGTRSAVLAPFRNLGIIVVDEEHDTSYKQTEGLTYSARDVAVKRGQLLGIPVVLGSATPCLETLENVRRRRYRVARLRERPGAATLPRFSVLDVRGLTLREGLAESLLGRMDRHLATDGQVLVFVNRRGYAPVLVCGDCGWQALCAHCDARLTTHRWPSGANGSVEALMVCHHCEERYRLPAACPDCGGDRLRLVGIGTQRVEDALAERYPGVPLYRIDRDTTRRTDRLAADLDAIRAGGAAILVGTQMLAKGHHLPDVTLVAVVDADAGFLSADFRAPERTAQLIVQVAGRAGRAGRPGEVWIQTLDPDNGNLRALIDSGYEGFVRTERDIRRAVGMPPFGALAVVRAESRDEAAAVRVLEDVSARMSPFAVQLAGPSPAFPARRADRHRQQLLALSEKRKDLHRALAALTRSPPDAGSVRWSIDVDPLGVF